MKYLYRRSPTQCLEASPTFLREGKFSEAQTGVSSPTFLREGKFLEAQTGVSSPTFLREGNLEENGDLLLSQLLQIKGSSCSVGNFAAKLVQALFASEELAGRNCTGRKGKQGLERTKLDKIESYVNKMYPVTPNQRGKQWKNCIIAIDELLRRRKRKLQGKIERQE